MRTEVGEDYILHLNCKTDSCCHQFAVFPNRLLVKDHPVSAWAVILTVVGEMAFRLSQKPANNTEQQGGKT